MHMRNDHAVALIERIERNVVRHRPQPVVPEVSPVEPVRRRPQRVLLRVDTRSAFGRGVLAGIARYNREIARWSICVRCDAATNTWSGDGIIECVEGAVARSHRDTVVVNLCGEAPIVGLDHAHVARLAAQHLLERGLHQFAFVGSRGRAELFSRAIERSGKGGVIRFDDQEDSTRDWDSAQERLSAWIASLPKPIGILTDDDERGLAVLDACRRVGAIVPDDVAVIGVGNDATLCDLAIPPLSSIDVNAQGVGYEAAALLDRLMTGESAPARPIKLAPRGVITRRSTDTVAAEDEEVSRAVSYIRERACGGLQVGDVLAHTGMSRASLQQRMKQLLGRTIHQEIQRARLNRAKDLLAMSPLTIKQVARESGFASVQYMTRVFRAETGETPARFRVRRSVA